MSDLVARLKEVSATLELELGSESNEVVGVNRSDLLDFSKLMSQAAEALESYQAKSKQKHGENLYSFDSTILNFLTALVLKRDFLSRKRESGITEAHEAIRNDLRNISEQMVKKRLKAAVRLTPGLDEFSAEEHLQDICNEALKELEDILRDFI